MLKLLGNVVLRLLYLIIAHHQAFFGQSRSRKSICRTMVGMMTHQIYTFQSSAVLISLLTQDIPAPILHLSLQEELHCQIVMPTLALMTSIAQMPTLHHLPAPLPTPAAIIPEVSIVFPEDLRSWGGCNMHVAALIPAVKLSTVA